MKALHIRIAFVLCLCFVCLLALSPPAHAENIYVGREGGTVVWSMDRDTGELRIYADTNVHAPAWQGLAPGVRSVYVAPGVTTLPDNAFLGCSSLKEVFLPDTITTIGAYAFADCPSLGAISLPADLSYVGEYAFRGCVLLRQLTFRGTSEAWDRLCLQASALAGNDALTSLTPIYTLPTCTLTVHYVDAETGVRVCPSTERVVTQGGSCTVLSPRIEYYAPDEYAVTVKDLVRDRSVTVLYRRTHGKLTVHYVDEKGATVRPSQTMSVAYGTAVTLQAPLVAGYAPKGEDQVLLDAVMQDETAYTFVYTRVELCVTVHCVDEAGTPLCDPIVIRDVPYGGAYYVSLPVFEGYTAEKTSLEGDGVTQSVEQSVRYTAKSFAITLHYVDEQGRSLTEPDVLNLAYGSALQRAPRVIEGYTPKQETLSLSRVTGAQSINVVYYPARYLLTVRHESEDGTLLEQTQRTLSFGESYRCQAITTDGYAVVQSSLDSAVGTMPARPLTVTLLYRAQKGGTAQPPTQGDTSNTDTLDVTTLLTLLIVVLTVTLALFLGLYLKKSKANLKHPPDTQA